MLIVDVDVEDPDEQDHRRWRYHRRLFDYQSPYSQLKFPLDHQIIAGHRIPLDHFRHMLSFEMTFRPSETLGSSKSFGL